MQGYVFIYDYKSSSLYCARAKRSFKSAILSIVDWGSGSRGGGEDGGGVDDGVVGGGEVAPSRLREEKVSISGLPRGMTRRRPLDGDGDRRW